MVRAYSCLALLGWLGCSSSTQLHPGKVRIDDRRRGAITIEQFDKRFGIIASSKTSPYLRQLNERILRRSSLNTDDVEVVVVNSRELITGALPGNYVILSRGLLSRLDVESEFAFVLAHEFSHFLLGHFQNSDDREPESELDADALAIQMMLRAGYEAEAARSALAKAYTSDAELVRGSHPNFPARLEALSKALQRSGGSLAGTIDRRGYQEFRHSLQR
jgi:predicted Zn-dependent protease